MIGSFKMYLSLINLQQTFQISSKKLMMSGNQHILLIMEQWSTIKMSKF